MSKEVAQIKVDMISLCVRIKKLPTENQGKLTITLIRYLLSILRTPD